MDDSPSHTQPCGLGWYEAGRWPGGAGWIKETGEWSFGLTGFGNSFLFTQSLGLAASARGYVRSARWAETRRPATSMKALGRNTQAWGLDEAVGRDPR